MSLPKRSGNWNRDTYVKTILTLAFVLVGSIYVVRHAGEFRSLVWPSAVAIIVVVCGFLASVFLRAVYNYLASRHLGAELSLTESAMLSVIVTASNVLLPANPGATFRAVYMKKVHNFPYTHFAGSTLLFLVATALLMSLFGVVLVLLISVKLGYSRPDLLIILVLIAALMMLGLRASGRAAPEDGQKIWASFRSAYQALVGDRRLVYTSIMIIATNFVIASFVWIVVLRDIEPNVATLEAFLFAASQIASGLISLTPGAAGFQEIVGIYVGQSFAVSAIELFAALIWVRLVRTMTAVVIAIPCAAILRSRTA